MHKEKITAYEVALQELHNVATLMRLSDEVVGYLESPERILTVKIPLRMDDGGLQFFTGYRAHHNSALGPVKGGTRFHKDETLDDVKALSFWMSIKNSLAGIPAGGAKGGIAVDPVTLSKTELERLCRGYIRAIYPMLGSRVDIPGPDVGTPQQVMAWFTDEYEVLSHGHEAAAIAGKPPVLGGSLGRDRATGYGLVYSVTEFLRCSGQKLEGKTVAIQGFGNLGSHAADFFTRHGAKVIAASDVHGGIYNPKGLPMEQALKHLGETGSIKGLPGCDALSGKELLEFPCDILVPAALQNQITEDNAGNVRAKLVAEGANGPTTPAAEDILRANGVPVLPDIVANCGGAVVGYFELVQDLQAYFWEEEEIFSRLKTIMTKTCHDVYHLAEQNKTGMRTAAWMLALNKIVLAMTLRGWVRE